MTGGTLACLTHGDDHRILGRAEVRPRIVVGLSSALLSVALAWLLWPVERFDPSRDLLGGVMAPQYVSRSGYYTYPPLFHAVWTSEDGKQSSALDTDEKGLRNPASSLADAQVILLGDSYASAIHTPVEKTFAHDLAELTGQRVYNAGVDGFSTFQETRLLRDLLATGAHPSRVVLLFFSGNDFRDNLIDRLPIRDAGLMGSPVVGEPVAYQRAAGPLMREAMRKTAVAFGELATLCSRHSIALTVVHVPARAEVYQSFDDYVGAHIFRNSVEEGAFNDAVRAGISFDAADERLREIVGALGIDYVSLLAPFRERVSDGLYGWPDAHWTPYGQALAAEIVATAAGVRR